MRLTLLAGLVVCAAACAQEELVLHHADFACRIGQKVFVEVGQEHTGRTLTATLAGPGGFSRQVCRKEGNISAEEVFTLVQRDLKAGDYTLTVRLTDGTRVLKEAVRKWTKPTDGIPEVGIDEHNAICLKGKPFFPVSAWGLSASDIPVWAERRYCNTLTHVAFGAEKCDIAHMTAYLDAAHRGGLKFIGPLRGNYWPHDGWRKNVKKEELGSYDPSRDDPAAEDPVWGKEGPNDEYYRFRRMDLAKMAGFIEAAKNHPALLMWSWWDEPDLGGRNTYITAREVRRWTDLCHEKDGIHPHIINLSGYLFTSAASREGPRQLGKSYCYLFDDRKWPPMGAATPFERKTLVADVLSFDYYPYEYRLKQGYEFITLEDYAAAVDNLREWNKNLVPTFAAIETCDIRANPTDRPPTPAITPRQLRNLCWISLVHGVKGVIWFHYFEPTPPENYVEMRRFVEDTTTLADAILGAEFPGRVTVLCPSEKFRVDTLAREHDGAVYLFAVYVRKGRDFADNLSDPPQTVTFTVTGLPADARVEVYGEGRTLQAKHGVFSDAFSPMDVHIYRVRR